MYRMKLVLCMVLLMQLLVGCYSPNSYVNYVSLRPTQVKDLPIPNDADIAVYCIIDDSYNVNVVVQNLTDDVLTIDQTKSFFVNSNQKSTAYFDPTVRTTTNSTSYGSSSGGSFNLGGLANVFGIGGVAGSLMRATTLGKSNSETHTSTHTEVMADMPQVSIGPRGKMAMSKTFKMWAPETSFFVTATPDTSHYKFSVTITYSFDGGETTDIINSEFFVNSHIKETVTNGKTGDAVRAILQKKPNATLEPWYKFTSSRDDGFDKRNTFINYK